MQRSLNDAKIDLTVDQWVVLDHIKPNPGISQIDIGLLTFKDSPTITRILNILVKKELVIRNSIKEDKRKTALYLTPKGEILFEKTYKIIVQSRINAWKNLNESDYAELVRIMDTIYSNIEN